MRSRIDRSSALFPVRDRVRDATGLDVPVIEADPETLRDVVLHVARERDAARETAALGPAFVREVHDGRRSAEVLAAALR